MEVRIQDQLRDTEVRVEVTAETTPWQVSRDLVDTFGFPTSTFAKKPIEYWLARETGGERLPGDQPLADLEILDGELLFLEAPAKASVVWEEIRRIVDDIGKSIGAEARAQVDKGVAKVKGARSDDLWKRFRETGAVSPELRGRGRDL